MQKFARQVARLGKEEEADLGDVRAGSDVDEVVFFFGVERVGAGKLKKLFVDEFEVPRVVGIDGLEDDGGFG